jgi:hypothetical protein
MEARKTQITPLWIVAAFVTLTEIVLGYAVTKTTDGIQVSLTVFVILFALSVAGVFFVILWNRPYVFYAPSEYGSVDPKSFIDAVKTPPYPHGKDVLTEAQVLLNRLAGMENQEQRKSITSNISNRLEIASEIQTAQQLLLIPGYDVSVILDILKQVQSSHAVDSEATAEPRHITPSTVDVILETMLDRKIVSKKHAKVFLTEQGTRMLNALRNYLDDHERDSTIQIVGSSMRGLDLRGLDGGAR